MDEYDLLGAIILKINDIKVENIEDVKSVMKRRDYNDPIKMTFTDRQGEINNYIFR